MPVGHGGEESKHKAEHKIAILEFIQARLKDIVMADPATLARFNEYVDELDQRYDLPGSIIEGLNGLDETTKRKIMADLIVKVYDPFTTEMDFYICLDVNWNKYEEIYGKYYDEGLHGAREHAVDTYYKDDDDILKLIHGGEITDQKVDYDAVFNASRSKSVIFHTITEMREILGLPVVQEP